MPIVLSCAGQLRRGNAVPAGGGGGGGGGANDYYNTLKALPQAVNYASLRAITDLTEYTINDDNGNGKGLAGAPPATWWSYDATEDASKLTWDRTTPNVPTGYQLKLPVRKDTGRILLVHDFKYGGEWRDTSLGGQVSAPVQYNHKEFQTEYDDLTSGTGDIYWETLVGLISGAGTPNVNDPDFMGQWHIRNYATALVEGQTDFNPYEPRGLNAATLTDQPLKHGKWYRSIQEHRLNVDASAFTHWNTAINPLGPLAAGTYHMVSCWMIEEGTDPADISLCRRLFQVPLLRQKGEPPAGQVYDSLIYYTLEHNTSTNNGRAQGDVRFDGVDGTVITNGTVVTRDSDSRAYTVINGSYTISGGSVVGTIRDNTGFWGEPGNTANGAGFSCGTAGVTDVTGVTALTGGYYLFDTDCRIWARNMIALQDYTIHDDTPESSHPEIFAAPLPA